MATKYNDIVTLRSMKPAYNIKYEGPDDWKSFIANDQFNDLLRKTISAVRNNDADNHKPIWIAGTYGSGKSHAGAVLKHLLCDSIDKITEYVDEEYHDSKYDLLRNSLMNLRHDTRLFPVNLYGQQDIAHEADLSLQLQKEVKNALKKEGISITVQTDFDNYIQHIENEPAFWEMLIQNNDELRSVAPSTDKLKSRLRSCDTEVLDRMRMALRNGGYSIPLQTANLQNWLFEVQGELRKQGTYKGLLIIWDEFTDIVRSDIGVQLLKILQNIAEAMMSPENDSYFLFLSHPSALNSLKEAERTQTMGRYHYVTYNMETVSAFRIMSKKFKVEDREKYELHRQYFCSILDELLTEFSSSSTDPSQTKADLSNLFPLHPATANLATYFAREAGSSSRSVFEFLACNEVKAFFDDEETYANKETITSDYLWDYVQEYFESDSVRFGAVTEKFNSNHVTVEAQGNEYLAVFKGVLLLNALNNIANESSVTPSEENILKLFEGTMLYDNVPAILAYFNEKGIIQRQPDGNYSILYTALPSNEIQGIKDDLRKTTYLYTDEVIVYGGVANAMIDRWLLKATRQVSFKFFSLSSNEYVLLNKLENFSRTALSYSVVLAIFVGRTKQELIELQAIVEKAVKDERFLKICFFVVQTPMDEKKYERFIEYQANATCAQKHGLADQKETYSKNSEEMISNWMSEIRSGSITWYLHSEQGVISGSKIASALNTNIAPKIFTAGLESLMLIQMRNSNTYWKKASVKATVDSVLSYNTKQEVYDKLVPQAKHVEYLFQDSLDDNLEWKQDVGDEHPLKKVSNYIDSVLKRYRTNNQVFNLGEKLLDLTKPPYGLFQSYGPMAMVAFAMRKYVGKIFDTNGKPRTAKHLVDDIVEMFKVWESGKTSNKLNFMFESKEAGSITKNLIKRFKLDRLPGYSDVSSLTDARWAMTHEYSASVGYPLWSLKYVPECSDENRELIDGIIKVITDSESVKNPQLMSRVAEGLKNNIDLGNLLLESANNFEKGFKNYVMGLEYINMTEPEFAEAKAFLGGHLEGTIGLWTERGVEDTLKNWRLDQQQERLRQENQKRFEEEQKRYKGEATTQGGNDKGVSTWMNNGSQVGGETVTMAASPQFESQVMKEKRNVIARKVMPLASNQMLRDLLQDLCENADEQTLNIILKHV
ncbi:putative uncharacterized protein [Prevotella sp. CAG:386]|nr:hypothetical protein [Prevotella sp. CAG:386]CDC25991.1 putative uncharacterized protein [Prevotella sp. CAG:386]